MYPSLPSASGGVLLCLAGRSIVPTAMAGRKVRTTQGNTPRNAWVSKRFENR